jgi:1-hydroxycarotenoid 3,4-desaturase
MPENRAVVVGSGIAALVAALRLAHQGVQVTVLERAAHSGGKLRAELVAGKPIDAGPTVFTMKWVFSELLESIGVDLDRELKLTPLPVIGRHFWDDGSALDLFTERAASESAVEAFSGGAEAARFRKFCDATRELYRQLEGPFIRAQAPSLPKFMLSLGPRGLATLAAIGPKRTLWEHLGRHFTDPRLRQLFSRYATYCGSSPWQAPATLSLIAQVEMDGVWSVQGGMVALAQCLTRLGIERGVQFRYNSDCREIRFKNGRACGVRLADGEEVNADVVIFNGDAAALQQGLLGSTARAAVPTRKFDRSLSATTWAMVARTRGLRLDRHNLFFNRRYASEFEDIFGARRLPQDPTVYLCAQDRGAGSGLVDADRLLCLVNAPAIGGAEEFSQEAVEALREKCFARMKGCGLNIDFDASATVCTTPEVFSQRFAGTGGALYGQATHGWLSIFSRPGSVSPLPGLYLAGGSIHPGPGVPMAAMSGRLVAEAVLENLGLTKSFYLGATSGGMSTP